MRWNRWCCWTPGRRWPSYRSHRAVAIGLCAVTLCVTVSAAFAQPAAPPIPGELDGSATPLGSIVDRPITSLRATIALPGPEAPENVAAPQLEQAGVCYQPTGLGRGWLLQPYEWDATALRHLPLYFEEPNLERLGYYYGCPRNSRLHRMMFCSIDEYTAALCDEKAGSDVDFACYCSGETCCSHNQLLQPMVSAAHFFGRVAALPYMMGACCPHCEVYELGRDRPGSPVCYRKYYMPLSLTGALYQGAAVTGIGYAIP